MATRTARAIPVERQNAAQAAGFLDLDDLPALLAAPDAAVRVGRAAAKDTRVVAAATLDGITRIRPRQLLLNMGRAEAAWAVEHDRRRARAASFVELVSYARQVLSLDDAGNIVECLMGHPGHGSVTPLWVRRDDTVLTLQPNDLVLRFDPETLPAGITDDPAFDG